MTSSVKPGHGYRTVTASKRVVRELLDQVSEWRGKPQAIRSDNGLEHIGSTPVLRLEKQGIRLEHIQPGNRQQSAYVERYNRTVGYDWLGLFKSIVEVQEHPRAIWTYMTLAPNRSWPWWPDFCFWRVLKGGITHALRSGLSVECLEGSVEQKRKRPTLR
jgi:putative transposase